MIQLGSLDGPGGVAAKLIRPRKLPQLTKGNSRSSSSTAPIQDTFTGHPIDPILLQGCDRRRGVSSRRFEHPLPVRRSPQLRKSRVFKEVCVGVDVLCVYPLVQDGFSEFVLIEFTCHLFSSVEHWYCSDDQRSKRPTRGRNMDCKN